MNRQKRKQVERLVVEGMVLMGLGFMVRLIKEPPPKLKKFTAKTLFPAIRFRMIDNGIGFKFSEN